MHAADKGGNTALSVALLSLPSLPSIEAMTDDTVLYV